jgi:hypothetical protein
MKRLLVLCLLGLMVLAVYAAANPIKSPWGYVVPSPDPSRTDLMICDGAPGPIYIYVICQFSAPRPACFAAAWLGDTPAFPVTIGNSQSGVSIGFGACRTPPVLALTITYYGFGATPPDCIYLTLPNPNNPSGLIQFADCNFEAVDVPGGGNYINPPEADCWTIATESKTWGGVKSLFAE